MPVPVSAMTMSPPDIGAGSVMRTSDASASHAFATISAVTNGLTGLIVRTKDIAGLELVADLAAG